MAADDVLERLSDEELITKAQKGDKKAFEMLHERYRNRILNYIYRLTGNYGVAEELTQETFFKIYCNLTNYKSQNVGGWIYTIAHNITLNELKRKRHQITISLYEPIAEDGQEIIDTISSNLPSQAELFAQKEMEEKIQRALNNLPHKYREVVVLCAIQGLSYQEAAKILNCDSRTVGVRLFRARKLMRKYYYNHRRK